MVRVVEAGMFFYNTEVMATSFAFFPASDTDFDASDADFAASDIDFVASDVDFAASRTAFLASDADLLLLMPCTFRQPGAWWLLAGGWWLVVVSWCRGRYHQSLAVYSSNDASRDASLLVIYHK